MKIKGEREKKTKEERKTHLASQRLATRDVHQERSQRPALLHTLLQVHKQSLHALLYAAKVGFALHTSKYAIVDVS